MSGLAERVISSATMQDLILPENEKQILQEIVIHVTNRNKVYEEWGFGSLTSRGLGITALFSGLSGTGKTMAAEVLANELGLDLYKIDLSTVVSKYIGETEKNIRRVFDGAEGGGTILFFDEADALFGKRTEVRDSHDRLANIEISYLLTKMESYRGLAILATNMRNALDTAFLRRIRFVVNFPFPDYKSRKEIWKSVFPVLTPVGEIDHESLAQLNISGGNIRNIALNASFLAADEGSAVNMKHLKHAAQMEYAKLEKPFAETEVGGWK
jgi:SpoVK/Ycf46/Vps4 family AAA+-type ATPase